MLAATNDAGFMTRPVWTLMHRLPPFASCPRMPLAGGRVAGAARSSTCRAARSSALRAPVSRPPILLIGAGGHARACIDVIEQEGRFAVAGLVGARARSARAFSATRSSAPTHDLARLLREQSAHALVAVGQIKTPEPRMRLFDVLERTRLRRCRSIVSPRAYVSPPRRRSAPARS